MTEDRLHARERQVTAHAHAQARSAETEVRGLDRARPGRIGPGRHLHLQRIRRPTARVRETRARRIVTSQYARLIRSSVSSVALGPASAMAPFSRT